MFKKSIFLFTTLFSSMFCSAQNYVWSNLPSAPVNGGKQDGIYFVNKDTGWVVNGSGRIYKTVNGGSSWLLQRNTAGTYFRCVAFVNDQVGFAGNIGTGYFPGVTDSNPLYKTTDGGTTWNSVTQNITGVVPAGICGIHVVNNNVIYAAGRVGSPPVIIKSTDEGNTWTGINLSSNCQMIFDVYFHSADTGYVFAATSANTSNSNARILRTTDGGLTWTPVYTSTRFQENVWKAWFPSHNIGYGTIQSYNTAVTQRYIVKTTDGGLTWSELPLVNTPIKEFGVGFINDTVGWVGGETTGYETTDGGLTWTNKNIGQYANKFSVINNPAGGKVCYAVGLNVYKMSAQAITTQVTTKEMNKSEGMLIYPNPSKSDAYVSISLDKLKDEIVKADMLSVNGKSVFVLFDTHYEGISESPFMFRLPNVPPGQYTVRFFSQSGKRYEQKMVITD